MAADPVRLKDNVLKDKNSADVDITPALGKIITFVVNVIY